MRLSEHSFFSLFSSGPKEVHRSCDSGDKIAKLNTKKLKASIFNIKVPHARMRCWFGMVRPSKPPQRHVCFHGAEPFAVGSAQSDRLASD